jgi:hypothetical protein
VKAFFIEVRWSVVTEEDGSPYSFPKPFSPFIRKNYCSPVIYRWRVLSADSEGPEAVYIGEAENLSQRVQRVLTPSKSESKGGQTNRRLRKEFDERLTKGRVILLETADFEDFEFNSVRFSKQQLYNRFHRCALENLLLAIELTTGREVLNHYVTPEQKATHGLRKLFPHASDEKIMQAVRQVLSKRSMLQKP